MRKLLLLFSVSLFALCLIPLSAHAVNCDMTAGSFNGSNVTTAITAAKNGTCTHTAITSPITKRIPNGYNSFFTQTFPLANIVYFTAGSTTISNTTNVGCVSGQAAVLITGPAKSDETNLDINPTATINGPVAGDFWMHINNCSQSGLVAITDLEWNGNRPGTATSCTFAPPNTGGGGQNCVGAYHVGSPYDRTSTGNILPGVNNSTAPSGGGGGIQIDQGGMSTPTYIAYNYLHGNQGGYAEGPNSGLLYVPGSTTGPSGSYTSNVFYDWNQLGNPSTNTSVTGPNNSADCSNVLFVTYLNAIVNTVYASASCLHSGCATAEYGDVGNGYCSGAFIVSNVSNFHIDHNRVTNQEQAFKEIGGNFPNVYFANGFYTRGNSESFIHRNPIEYQGRGQGSDGMILQYNTLTSITGPAGAGLGYSVPSCCAGTGSTGPSYTSVLDNVFAINDQFNNQQAMDVEYWSSATASYNLMEGNPETGIAYGYTGSPVFSANYNKCMQTSGNCVTPESCTSGAGCYSTVPPTQVGNTQTTTITQVGSAAPTFSPTAQAISSPTVITVTDLGNGTNNTTAGPRANTSIYCTTDGSSPTTSSTWIGTGSGTITVSPGATLKCIGMWGSRNQPKVWPSPFGYVPSGIVSATYSNSGGPTTGTPVFSPTSQTYSGSLSVSVSSPTTGATIYCTTDSSTPTTSSPVYSGPFTVGTTETIQCLASSPGASNSGVGSATYTNSTPPPPPALTGVTIGGPSSIIVGATGNYSATCHYDTAPDTNCTSTDSHGNDASFSSSATGVATVTSAGVATAVSMGNSTITTSVGGFTSTIPLAVVAQPSTTNLGVNQFDTPGVTFPNAVNSQYVVIPAGTTTTISSCSIYLPTGYTYTAGGKYDCLLTPAPSALTQSSSVLCFATYTTQGTAADVGWHQLPVSGCGTVGSASSAIGYQIGVSENLSGPIGMGFYGCGAASGASTGNCTGPIPTSGVGTYQCAYALQNYGVYVGNTTTLTSGCGPKSGVQLAAYFSLTTPTPTLTGGYFVVPGSTAVLQAGYSIQMYAVACYSDGNCYLASPSADQYGDTLTSITSSNPSVLTVGAVGGSTPALATAKSVGTAVISGFIGSKPMATYGFTTQSTPAVFPPMSPRVFAR